MKTLKIGTRAYPVDNSWSYTIGTNEKPCLAGTYKEPAKKVTIVSRPYKITIDDLFRPETYEFVTVMYNRKCHVILNNFRDKQPHQYDI